MRLWWRYSVMPWGRRVIESLQWKIAWMLPRQVALLAFVRVYAAEGQAPGPDYVRAYNAWASGAGKRQHWAIRLRLRMLRARDCRWNAIVRDATAALEMRF